MHGYRLEVEAHIITAAEAAVENLKQCVQATGVQISQIVLNSLASAEVSLSENERQMGVAICDIGGGTSDLAIYLDGDVWHTSELAIGGNHITSDIAQGLRIPVTQAEEIKRQYGYAIEGDISPDDTFTTRGFGNDQPQQVSRADLSHIIEARVEEIFEMLLQEIRRSGYDGLLPAGLVLTGGTSSLPGIRNLASRVLRLPVRVAMPDNLHGLVDQLNSPAFSTSIGLLHWALHMSEITPQKEKVTRKSEGSFDWQPIKVFLRRLLP
jgi:cell division protein FtsA